jgi:hypothetical protein
LLEPLTYNWSLVSTPKRSKAVISNPTAEIASLLPDLPGTYEVQLIVNDGSLNSLLATAEIEVVNPQTQLTMNIRSLQQVIANLPASAFKAPELRNDLLRKLNAVIESIRRANTGMRSRSFKTIFFPRSMGVLLLERLTGVTGLLTVKSRIWSIRASSTLSRRSRHFRLAGRHFEATFEGTAKRFPCSFTSTP